jgi:hypothetical protein
MVCIITVKPLSTSIVNGGKKRWVWVVATAACVVGALAAFSYPALWRVYQYYSVRQTIQAGDEDAVVRQVRALSRARLFEPDWTLGRAILDFRNELHLPHRKYYAVGYRDPNGVTLLQDAALHGDAKLVTTLLGVGASVDFYGDKGLRVLMDGVVGGNTNVIAALIGHGADVNTTYHGTPLIHVTCMERVWPKPEVVEFLLRAGAKPNVENPAGLTALDMAITYNTNLIPVLIANGGVAGHQKTVSSP